MSLKERDIKKATKAVGKSLPTKIAGPGGTRTSEFQGGVAEVADASPKTWKHVVAEAK